MPRTASAQLDPQLVQQFQYAAAVKNRRLRRERAASRVSRWAPHTPTAKQETFLNLNVDEALYGGAAGGGKSDAILMGALKYVDLPEYKAIIFRNTLADLKLPDGLIPRAHEWLDDTDARWNGTDYDWKFPSGAVLTFGYMDKQGGHRRYKGMAVHYVGYDELTEIREQSYLFLMSRLRKQRGSKIPTRVRAATNPGGRGHQWVKDRFVTAGRTDDCVFVPAFSTDNPYIDQEDYLKNLNKLDSIDRAQLLDGDWDAMRTGNVFRSKDWFLRMSRFEAEKISNGAKRVRYWDFAATAPDGKNDPDYTAGALLSFVDGTLFVWDIRRRRDSPAVIERMTRLAAGDDGPGVIIWIEQEPGASGVQIVDHYKRNVLQGYAVRGHKKTKSKRDSWKPLVAAAEDGRVVLVGDGAWIPDFLEEATGVEWEGDNGTKDDQLDVVSGGFGRLTRKSFMIA